MINTAHETSVRAKLSGAILRLTCLFLAGSYATPNGPTARAVSPEQVQDAVRANESLTNLVKLDYAIQYAPSPAPSTPSPASGGRSLGAPYTGYRGAWAQDGIRQYHQYDYLYGPDKPAAQQLEVVTGEVAISAKRPALMEGAIVPIAKHQWGPGPTLFSGIRPFESELRLSDFIGQQGATVEDTTQKIRGREAWVVVGQSRGGFYKILIDRERGVLLRLESYGDKDPRVTDSPACYATLDILETLQLPNGGWLPVRSERALGPDAARKSSYRVDPNSITIDRADIPDSLFTVDFPEGARVVNTITGTVTQGSKTMPWDPRLEDEMKLLTQMVVDDSLKRTPPIISPKDANRVPGQAAFAKTDGNTSNESESGARQGFPDIPMAEFNPKLGENARLLVLVTAAGICGVAATLIVAVWRTRPRSMEKR
jgi:hypothetical protein